MNKESKILLSLGLGTVVLLIAGSFFFSRPVTEKTTETPSPVDTALLTNAQAYKKGAEAPQVIVVEFADFQCPACAAAAPVSKQIAEEYKDSVQFVYRHFPLPMHKNAEAAAYAAEAAGEQGKFWEMHDLLFSTQKDWEDEANAAPKFEALAKQLSLDMTKYAESVKSQKTKDNVNAGLRDGNAAGVNSTPTFFINGIRYVGVLSATELKNAVESARTSATN